MAKLVFHVQADYEEVIKLRNEIDKLKKELKSMDATRSPASFNALNSQLSASTQRMEALVSSAAKVGAEMETGFKRKIFDASQAVNGFTEKIIAQKTVVKDVEYNVKRLGDAYRIALKRNPLSASGKLEEYNAARRALDEEKASLFGLTQQQAEARLSVKKLRDEYALYKDDVKDVVNANEGFAISWKKALAIIGGVGVLKALGSEIVRVRGEFQSTQTAIETLVGKDMAGNLIPQIKELAKISPLTMSDMVGAEKMMLGFNIQAEDTIKYLKALSDVSMGDSQRFNSLTLAFSQMSAAGKLMGQDLNQMINAGFNPLQIMADKTGKSISILKEEMSKGAISAEMVQQAFIDATSAGGKFYNMSENASKTINGQLSMMQDAINTVFNELGTKSEGVIMDGIQMTTSLIQNYETVGKVLTGLVVTYGAYRTAVMLVTAAESKHTLVEIGLTNARILARKAQLALNAAMLTNPYVAVATVVIGLTSAMWALHDSSTETEKAQRRFNEQQEEAAKQAQEHKQKIDALIQSSRDIALSDLQRGENLAALRSEYPKIFAQYDIETIKLADILKLKQQIAEEDAKRVGEKQAKNLSDIESEIKYYENLLKTLSGQQGIDGYVKKLKELRSTRNVMLQEKGKSISEQFISSLKDIDISEFDRYISELEKRIKGQGENGSIKLRLPIDVKGSLSDEAIYKVKDIKTLIDTAKSTKQTRIESEKNKTTYQQDYEKAKKDWEEAKKKLSEIEKDKSKFTSKQYEEAKKRADTTEKAYKALGGVTGGSLTKQENQAQKEAEAQIKQQERLSDQLLSLRRKNQQNEINLMAEGTEKKLAQIDLDYQKELDAIRKQEQEWTKANGGILTQEQSAQISLSYSQAENKRDKSISDVNKEELEAMNRYLKEYGTFLQKKEAITKEYNDKIAKATTEGDKKMLQKEMVEAIQSIDLSELKKGMNWEQIFGNLDKVSTNTLKRLKSNLKDFVSSQKDLSPENLKELVDAIERIDNKISERNPFEAMETSFKSLKTATDAQREAQKAYNKALKEGTDEEKKNAKSTLESAKNNKQKALSKATTALHKGVEEIGQYVDAGNQVIGIMETLGVKTPEWLEGTMSGFGEMLNGLERIDLTKPMSIVTGGLQTVKGALTSVISLGGLIPGLGGADYSGYEKMKAQYEHLITIWDELINKKMEYIDINYGTEAMKAAEEAEQLVNIQISRQRQLIKQLASSGASIGSHSLGYRIAERLSPEDFKRISDLAGEKITAEWQLWDLSSEKIEKILTDEKLVSVLDTVNKDFVTYLQNIADYGDQLTEIAEKEKEAITGMSFDEFKNGYADLLSDLDSTNEDFADNFEKHLQNAIFKSLIANEYKDKIKELYDTWAKYGEDGLSDNEVQQLRDMQQQLADSLLIERDKLMNAFGWDTDIERTQQSPTMGYSVAASQDSVDVLNGQLNAQRIGVEEIKQQNINQSQSLNLLTAKTDAVLSVDIETRNIADETRDLIAQSYLELVQISENTGNSAKYLKEIKADIAEVKKNTSNL
nr:MAG TPA: tail tape measure protein [Caudoviricetes sp.]